MQNSQQNFWNFSIELYRRPGVAEACLELQDSHGIDVNLLLHSYWYGESFGSVDILLLQEVVEFSSTWKQGIVQPLRSVRQWMKTRTHLVSENQALQFEALRERVKSEELSAEKIQQEMIEEISLRAKPANSATGLTAIRANLAQLLEICELPESDHIRAKLNVIAQAMAGSEAQGGV